jgi:hypothetical protein
VTEPGHLAINSGLGFVAADDFENLLRVRRGHLRWDRRLSLHTWRSGDHKSCKDAPQVSVMPTPIVIRDPKKSQNKKRFRLRERGDVSMWSTLFAFSFLIAVALSVAAIRLNL